MYSLDINLLRERPEYKQGHQTQFGNTSTLSGGAKANNTPLYIGGGVFLLTLLGIGGGWLWVGQETTQLEAKQQQLTQQLVSLKSQEQRLTQLNTEISQIEGENQSLASVFNQVQPWSAILQDLRETIPQGVQVANIVQSEGKGAAAATAAPPAPAANGGGLAAKVTTPPNPEAKPSAAPSPGASPVAAGAAPSPGASPVAAGAAPTTTLPPEIATTNLEITGTAKSFDEVNNFLLTLKRSAFFNPDETFLVSTNLTKAPIALEKPALKAATNETEKEQQAAVAAKLDRLELPKVVDYKIQTSVKRIPAADLMRELERKGAVGLVTRLRTLQQQQVLKP